MIEQEQVSQVSALFDGELPPHQAEMVIRRALRDPALRASWERYSLIGACLRGEPINRHDNLADRVQASLAAERELNVTNLPAPRRSQTDAAASTRSFLLGRSALGGAIAASVAVVSIMVVRAVAPGADEAGTLLAQGAPQVIGATDAGAAASSGAPGAQEAGYTTPGENSPAQRRTVDASLGHFLVAHSEEAAWALRYSYDAAPGGVELTEDQISALR